MANAVTYIRNVGKSIGYASIDVFKEKNPIIKDFTETNGSVLSDTYKTVRNLKKNAQYFRNREYMETEYGKFAQTYFDNLVSDIKTGKLYNKERKEKYDEEAAAAFMGGEDMNMDDIFGDIDDSYLDDDISTNDMMDIVAEKSSTAVSNAVARSAQYIVQANAQTTKAIQNQNSIMYAKMHNSMSVINENIANILKFSNENVNTHIENSRTFYEQTTRLDQDRNNYLKEISETLKTIQSPVSTKKKSSSGTSYNDLVSYEGVLDLSKYKQYVSKNLKNIGGGVFDMLGMMSETGMLKTLAASPLEGLSTAMISLIIPEILDKSLESLNTTLSGVTGNIFSIIKEKSNKTGGIFWDAISEIFGINTKRKDTYDTSNYEKGKVSFDGITRKSIIEVIPNYLSRILSALTGQERDTYDYDKGKFVGLESLKSYKDDMIKSSANSAARELEYIVRQKVRDRSVSFETKEQEEQFWKDWENIKLYMYKNQTRGIDTRNKKLNAKSFGLGEESDRTVEILKQILDGSSANFAYANRMYRETADHNRRMTDFSDHAAMNAIENESGKIGTGGGLSAILGQSNIDIISKLTDIHKELSYIRIYGTSGGGKKGKGGRPNFDRFTIPRSASQEKSQTGENGSTDTGTGKASTRDESSNTSPVVEEEQPKRSFKDRIKSMRDAAFGAIKNPFGFASSIVNKVDARIYELFYGPVDGREKEYDDRTISEILFDNLEKQFDKFSKWLDEKVFNPNTWKNMKDNAHDAAAKFLSIFGIDLDKSVQGIKEKLFGVDKDGNQTGKGVFSDFIKGFKDTFKDMGDWLKKGFKDLGDATNVTSKKNEQGQQKEKENQTVNNAVRAIEENLAKFKDEDIQQQATGTRRVQKTGLAVISEGEMIIPPDMNPFNIAKRYRNERKIKDNLKDSIDSIHEYAEGNMTKEEWKIFNRANRINNKINNSSKEERSKYKDNILNHNDGDWANVFGGKRKYNKDDYEEGRTTFGQRILDEILSAIGVMKETVDEHFTVNKKDSEKFKENAWNLFGDIKEHGGAIAAGGAVGAGVSLLTGLIGGPLVGAAAGASVALIKKSKFVQDALFGNEEEDKPGLLPKKITEFIQKYMPDMAKGGALGGILGLLPLVPGGPVSGLLLGSAIGFVKNNEKAQDVIFGDILDTTKEDFMDKVRTVLPKMGAGAIAGLVAGPFSVPVNILLGSAIGFATDTQLFKDKIFGDLKEFFSEKIVSPLKDAMDPFKKDLELIGKSILNLFKDQIVVPIGKTVKEKILNPIGKAFGTLLKPIYNLAKTVVASPFQLIGGIGNMRRASHIKHGHADYMKTADERLAFRQGRGKFGMLFGSDRFRMSDESLSGMDVDQLQTSQDALEAIVNSRKSERNIKKTAYNNISDALKNKSVSADLAKTIRRYVQDDQPDHAMEAIRKSGLNDEEKKKLTDIVGKELAKLQKSRELKSGNKETQRELLDTLEKSGFKIDPKVKENILKGKGRDAENLLNQIKSEKEYKSPAEQIADSINSEEQKRHEEIKKKIDDIISVLKTGDVNHEIHKEDINQKEQHFQDVATNENAEIQDSRMDYLRATYSKGAIRGTLKLLNDERRKVTDPLFTGVKDSLGWISGTALPWISDKTKKGYNFARDSRPANYLFGDRSVDWKNPETYKNSKNTNSEENKTTGFLAKMTGILTAIGIKNNINPEKIDTDKQTPNSLIKKVKGLFPKPKTVQYVNGLPLVYEEDKDGNPVVSPSVAENRDTLNAMEEEKEHKKGLLEGIKSIPNKLGGLFEKIFGSKDKDKKSIFSKILDFFTGGNGAKITFGSILSAVLKTAIPAALAYLGLSGKLDNIVSLLSKNAFAKKGSNDVVYTTDSEGNNVEIQLDEQGNPVTDENGNYVGVNGQVLSSDSYLKSHGSVATMSFSERLKYSLVRGTATGKGSVIGNMLKKTPLGKAATKVGSKIKGGISNIIKTATSRGAMDDIIGKLLDRLDIFIKALKKVPLLKKYINEEKLIDLGVGLGDLIEKYLPKAGAKLGKLATGLSKLALPIAIATAIGDFTTGWQDASNILRIKAEHVTTPQKIICGLVRAFKNIIPVVGVFIPDQVITDFFIDHVAKWFKINTAKIKNQQSEAEAELAEYNAENGTNYSWSEYNKIVNGEYTWTEKIGNGVSSFFANVKQNGLGKTLVNGIKNSKVGKFVSDSTDKIKTVSKSVTKAAKSIIFTALEGKNPLKMILSKGEEPNTGNEFLDSSISFINGLVKIPLTPIALITAGFNFAKNKIGGLFKSLSSAGELSQEDQVILDKANEGEISIFSKEYWKINTNLTGLAGGFNSFKSFISKVMNLPTAIVAMINPMETVNKGMEWVSNKLGFSNNETPATLAMPTVGIAQNATMNAFKPVAGSGSGINGRGNFISQLDPKYNNKQFNIAGDTQVQTLGDTGCAPAAAAMAVNATYGSQRTTMEDASKLALKYKVNDDGVSASYFSDEFARHGLQANYITNSDTNAMAQEIARQLRNNNKVVLMGQDATNASKAISPFGPNPHYVVANGLSEDGKFIYINDPESNRPNVRYDTNKILGTSKLGISANAAMGSRRISNKLSKYTGRGTYGADSVQYKVWNALRSAGYNEVATAAAMGNIQHESGFNPSVIEKGSSVGFGLAQWSYGRRTAMENYAKERGINPSNLDIQIEYLLLELQSNSGIWTKASDKYNLGKLSRSDWATSSDLDKATKAFMCCFERPSYDPNTNHIDRRLQAAREYYTAFTGKQVDGFINTVGRFLDTTASNIKSTANTVVDKAKNAFTSLKERFSSSTNKVKSLVDVIAEKYGFNVGSFGNESTDESGSYNNNNTTSDTNVSSATGNVSPNASKADLQKALVNMMYQLKGSLKYAQNNAKYPGSRNPEDGSGDCSSTVQYVYKKILGVDPGSWTGGQRDNTNTYTVATSTADESKLQLGDLLLKDGHVEMYAGNNTMIGHGGGKDGKTLGPTVKPLDKSGKYNLVRRWVGFKGSGSGLFGRGSDDHPEVPAYGKALQHINPQVFNSTLPFGLGDDELDKNKMPVIQFNDNKMAKVDVSKAVKPANGRAAQVTEPSKSNDMITLVKAIVNLLTKVVTNTDHLSTIVKLATEYISALETSRVEKTEESKNQAVLAKQNLINAMQNSTSSNEPSAQLMRLIEQTERIARE